MIRAAGKAYLLANALKVAGLLVLSVTIGVGVDMYCLFTGVAAADVSVSETIGTAATHSLIGPPRR